MSITTDILFAARRWYTDTFEEFLPIRPNIIPVGATLVDDPAHDATRITFPAISPIVAPKTSAQPVSTTNVAAIPLSPAKYSIVNFVILWKRVGSNVFNRAEFPVEVQRIDSGAGVVTNGDGFQSLTPVHQGGVMVFQDANDMDTLEVQLTNGGTELSVYVTLQNFDNVVHAYAYVRELDPVVDL